MKDINNKIIFITGTPGVGKTTIANNLNNALSKKYDSKLFKINELAIENGLIQGKDLEKGYKIVDIDKLCKNLNEVIYSFFNEDQDNISNTNNYHDSYNSSTSSTSSNSSNNYKNYSNENSVLNNSNNFKIAIIEGHLSHLCNIEDNIDTKTDFKVIVLRLNPDILQNRLTSRNYSEEKIHENLEAEALAVCSVEAYENHGKNVNEIDTTNLEIKDVLKIVEDILFNKKEFPVGNVDFMQWILD